MSPPLVVAFALAGTVDIDMTTDPIGKDKDGQDVYLKDLWPTLEEIGEGLKAANDPETYQRLYRDFAEQNPLWQEIPSSVGQVYDWDPDSTYIQEPPYFDRFSMEAGTAKDIKNARPLAIFGDSVTTDHISPAGAIKPTSPAGLLSAGQKGRPPEDFNSYGSRRGNDRIMVRGTFANVRIKNLMVPGVEGGVTVTQPDGVQMSIYDASMKYQAAGIPLLIFAGQEYGTGSSRDWAAKGTRAAGRHAPSSRSRSSASTAPTWSAWASCPASSRTATAPRSLGLDGTETFDLVGLENGITPRMDVTLVIKREDGETQEVPVTLRIDTPIEVDYYLHGGILPYVLRQLIEHDMVQQTAELLDAMRPGAAAGDEVAASPAAAI